MYCINPTPDADIKEGGLLGTKFEAQPGVLVTKFAARPPSQPARQQIANPPSAAANPPACRLAASRPTILLDTPLAAQARRIKKHEHP